MTKRPEITARTRAEIQEAFWRLYLEQPIDTITVQRICDRAGYTRGTFYTHFRDRYEVLESIEAAVLDGMSECVETCFKRIGKSRTKVACLAGLAGVMAYYESNKTYIEKFLGTDDDPTFSIRLRDRLKPLWREYVVDQAVVQGSTRGEGVRGEGVRGEGARGETGRGEGARGEAGRGEGARGEAGRSEDVRSDAEIDLLLDYALSGAIAMISNWLRGTSSVSAAELGHLVYDAAIKDVTARL